MARDRAAQLTNESPEAQRFRAFSFQQRKEQNLCRAQRSITAREHPTKFTGFPSKNVTVDTWSCAHLISTHFGFPLHQTRRPSAARGSLIRMARALLRRHQSRHARASAPPQSGNSDGIGAKPVERRAPPPHLNCRNLLINAPGKYRQQIRLVSLAPIHKSHQSTRSGAHFLCAVLI